MRLAVVGAGIAGLGAARKLVQAGHQVVVFEKSRSLGGRAASRQIGDYLFDSGATSIAPRGLAIESVMTQELDASVLRVVERPIFTHQLGRISPGEASHLKTRYAYSTGMNTLGRMLADGLDVRFEAKVESISPECEVMGEKFDAVIAACPLPQSLELLPEKRRPNSRAHYRMCLSVLLGFDQPFQAPWHALIEPEQVEPLTWLSAEHLKCDGRAPIGHSAFVAQLSRTYSQLRFQAEEEVILRETLLELTRLLGQKFSAPVAQYVHRWRYSQPEELDSFDDLNPPGTKILLAGDGLAGARIESAYESGIRAANRILEL